MSPIVSDSTAQRFRWLLAELLVIVLGILIAFQVDEWRTNRDNRSIEIEGLAAIYQDLDIEMREIQSTQEYMRLNRQNWLRMMALLRMDTELSEEDIYSAFGRYTTLRLQPNNSAFTSLVESGRISLISNEELQLSLVNFFQIRQPRIHFINQTHNARTMEYIDILLLDIDFVTSSDFEATRDYDYRLTIPIENFPSHPSLMRVLVDLDLSYERTISRLSETLVIIEDIQHSIRAQIK
ncbi:MAG: hypothetical protein COA96_14275 [SAR86 cluster bacterium]|uniref:Uncharacterized protein n=1 Tax=SAR86 cluster bacterium TaxID=2030880 RepID=A0A2A5ATB6_9GAMM|nr:MAG: hypothetical protein COA96_14275 [SAR86 cluster bacterium]